MPDKIRGSTLTKRELRAIAIELNNIMPTLDPLICRRREASKVELEEDIANAINFLEPSDKIGLKTISLLLRLGPLDNILSRYKNNSPLTKFNKQEGVPINSVDGDSSPPLCACGCGERTKWCKARKKWNKYINGHHTKVYITQQQEILSDHQKIEKFAKKFKITIKEAKAIFRNVTTMNITQTIEEVKQCKQLQNILS